MDFHYGHLNLRYSNDRDPMLFPIPTHFDRAIRTNFEHHAALLVRKDRRSPLSVTEIESTKGSVRVTALDTLRLEGPGVLPAATRKGQSHGIVWE
jgi:hypothetical protein